MRRLAAAVSVSAALMALATPAHALPFTAPPSTSWSATLCQLRQLGSRNYRQKLRQRSGAKGRALLGQRITKSQEFWSFDWSMVHPPQMMDIQKEHCLFATTRGLRIETTTYAKFLDSNTYQKIETKTRRVKLGRWGLGTRITAAQWKDVLDAAELAPLLSQH